jgi:paraquat-inducible protein A
MTFQTPENGKTYILCEECAHPVPVTGSLRLALTCERCGHHIHKLKPKSRSMTLAFALTALIFYFPANMMPFMTMELYGQKTSSTIWQGVVQLHQHGDTLIAVVIFLASLLIPLLKLLVLFFICATSRIQKLARLNTHMYRAIELIGRWSMLDIFLLAVLVAIMKLGPMTRVVPEPGALMFLFVVIFTMLASASFDPRLLWNTENFRKGEQ